MVAEAPLALVTGAAQGIGEAVVRRLRLDGLRVLALDRDAEGLRRLATDLQAGDEFAVVIHDLTDLEGTPAVLDGLVTEHGAITRLVLNAGVWPGAPIMQMSNEIWKLNFDVNVSSPFVFLRTLAPVMAKAGGGAVSCTASRNAYRSSTNNAAYDASKAALLGLVRTAAGELAKIGIRVNAVSPGVISTPGTPEIEEPSFREPYLKQIPMDRYGCADEIAAVHAFLLSDDASFLTGQDIVVDGGQIACQDNGRFLEIPGIRRSE
ncbi:MAG: SDR family NAD(P)-dependent oxidoreductase [Candidatus Latescibacterota bacterium]|nr:SDR family NAD(P)-dependent oxidoreductase [Candidatus Latescibacterota bacterium]